jgi:sugar O-acyltransferase (sialic acid O-acetyltransferase NeuD family)
MLNVDGKQLAKNSLGTARTLEDLPPTDAGLRAPAATIAAVRHATKAQGPTAMKQQTIVILGGAGSGVIVAEAIAASAAAGVPIALLGFLNDATPAPAAFAGAPVLGPFEAWHDCPADAAFISAIPKPKEAWARFRRIASLGIPRERWATVVHPTACLAADASLGPGTYVGPLAVVEPGVTAGMHACLRGGSYVSHEVRLADFVFVGPNATVLGRVTLAEGAHIGANAACREEIAVGRYAVVGIGATVIADVPEFAIAAGNPARIIGRVAVGAGG